MYSDKQRKKRVVEKHVIWTVYHSPLLIYMDLPPPFFEKSVCTPFTRSFLCVRVKNNQNLPKK